MPLSAGVARTDITPFWGVELTGWGYYLGRTWERIRDRLGATALVLDDGRAPAVLISLDLMVVGTAFVRDVRDRIARETGIPGDRILVAATHSHNAPAAQGLLGVGECDPEYERFAARQAATAAILAFRSREPVRAASAATNVPGITFNRTRPQGVVDPRLTTLRLDRLDGSVLAFVVGFQGHPVVHTLLRPRDVTRDMPGETCDVLEAACPGATALYFQGACGDSNFLREFSTPERCHDPARIVAGAALAAQSAARVLPDGPLGAASLAARLPTRRWTAEEVARDRDEAQRRLAAKDAKGWRETLGRSLTNRPDDMVARHGGDEWKAVEAMCRFHVAWTWEILKDRETRPEHLDTEVQAFVLGDFALVSNASEFFSPFALDVRNRSGREHLICACYADGRIGYVPDEHDIAARSYAAWTSPKYCLQFPFTPESGPALCDAMLEALGRAARAAA